MSHCSSFYFFLVSLLFCESKLNIFGVWIAGGTKQDIWRLAWALGTPHYLLTFYRPNTSIKHLFVIKASHSCAVHTVQYIIDIITFVLCTKGVVIPHILEQRLKTRKGYIIQKITQIFIKKWACNNHCFCVCSHGVWKPIPFCLGCYQVLCLKPFMFSLP